MDEDEDLSLDEDEDEDVGLDEDLEDFVPSFLLGLTTTSGSDSELDSELELGFSSESLE